MKPHWPFVVWPCDRIGAILRFPPLGHAPPRSSSRSPISGGGGLRRLELGAVFQHREHDDGESACESNPRLAHRRSPGDIERPVFERETAAVAGQHHIGGLVEQRAEPPVAAFGDAAGIVDLTGLITPRDQAGRWLGPYADTMIDHDKNVGTVLAKLKELGLEDNTLIFYSTDNGPHMNSWPDAAMTPFRNEKNSNWEGAYRVPATVRWPGKIKPGSVSNEIISHLDWLPTLLAMAGVPDVKEKLLSGYTAGKETYKVHLDGYNLLPYLTGEETKGPRKEFFYFSDDGDLTALRFDNWKLVFAEQRAPGTLRVWSEPFTHLRVPLIYNLRLDPYERANITSNTYYDWLLDHAFMLMPAQTYVGQFLATFKDFPPRQKAASFTIDQALQKLQQPSGD